MADSLLVTLLKKIKIKWIILGFIYIVFVFAPLYGITSTYYVNLMIPSNFPNTKWTCEDENMWFISDESSGSFFYGQRIYNGCAQQITFVAAEGKEAGIYEYADAFGAREGRLWWGDVKYKKDRVILLETDDSCEESIFDEADFPITFVREDLSEEEIEALKNGR